MARRRLEEANRGEWGSLLWVSDTESCWKPPRFLLAHLVDHHSHVRTTKSTTGADWMPYCANS